MIPVLEIHNVSKKFMINHKQQPYLSLRDKLTNFFKSKNQLDEFWALNDVSFNLNSGESLAIIGKNGAGKSTILKILSRITPPTHGRIISRGRIASLLEVGTGFHAELTGRENVYMNGSILGMSRKEIKKNFDAIVDFAGVERFIDTPLKHYSSGMQLRLAFSVAAFLENEILIIDEVLAVGDSEFQKKCLGKMEDVSNSGKTILFVSHNMSAIKHLCNRAILLNNGNLIADSSVNDVIKMYLNNSIIENNNKLSLQKLLSFEDSLIKIKNFMILQEDQDVLSYHFDSSKKINLFIEYKIKEKIKGLRVGFELKTPEGQIIFRTFHDDNQVDVDFLSSGDYVSQAIIPQNILSPIDYYISISIGIHNIKWIIHDSIEFIISSNGVPGFNKAYHNIHEGMLMMLINWENKRTNEIPY
jgi:lipopolysaccharide transport system ATP-binding protein